MHRNVLAQHSDVFKAMLTTDMREGISRVIELPEKSKTLQQLFTLMYKGEFVDQNDIKELLLMLMVTKKYLMTDLEEKCMEHLIGIIEARNVVELLIFSNENDLEELKKASLEHIGR